MPLNDTRIRAAKADTRPYKLGDFDGLSLHVQPNGSKWWRFRYRFLGKEKMLSLGTYPEVSLLEARERRDAARKLVATGIDPSRQREADRRAHAAVLGHTFRALANEWFEVRQAKSADSTRAKIRFYLDRDLIPILGDRPLPDITRPELVDVLRRFEQRKAFNVAKKARGWLGQLFKYAMVKGVIDRNPATDLDVVAIRGPATQPHAALRVSEVPGLLLALNKYRGSPLTKLAVRLLLFTGVRPGELRNARWAELDLDAALWSVPAERMKMRKPHLVPLPTQAIQALRELKALTGTSPLLFPSRDNRERPMSENTVNVAIARIGYKGKQTGHGFRHLISTTLNDMNYNRDWIERQLSHGDANGIRGTYNHALYIEQRHKMMQAWADYLDNLDRC
ncbi:MAG: integrase [Xanthomonadaceae bacterium]|nr:integrase [Xanthomonadaceae bacterium]